MSDEIIVFLMREFSWTLEYTVNLVKTLPIKKLNTLISEIQYQKALEDYKTASNFALIVSTLASTSKRKYKITDIIGHPPKRAVQENVLSKAAKREGIRLPEDK